MSEPWTIRRLRAWIGPFLAERGVESHQLCADLLLGHVLGCQRLQLYMDADRPATPQELARLRDLVQRAGRHEPVQYLVGSWSFHGCELEVGPSTLIPRPCTETIVDEALAWIAAEQGSAPAAPLRIVDLCTGTGCIAIALARALRAQRSQRRQLAWRGAGPGAPSDGPQGSADGGSAEGDGRAAVQVVATDVHEGAVELARRNVAAHKLGAVVEVVQCDLDGALADRGLEGAVDILSANPPYISDREWASVPRTVREWEPESALRGGSDGLALVRRVIGSAARWLRPGGLLLCEIAASQEASALEIARAAGLREVTVVKDLEGLPRVLRARRE